MIKAVIFDCFGVLTVTDLWKNFVDSQPEGVDRQALSDLNRALDTGVISRESFFKAVHDLTGSQPKQVEDILNPDINKNLPLIEYIQELKTAGYKVGLLSNISSDWIKTTFLSDKEQELFDDMVMSYEVGLIKPDPRIFELACERLGVQPKDTIFIDDSEYNCRSAKDLGISAIVYDDFSSCKKSIDQLIT